MDTAILWRVAIVQLLAVAALSLLLGLLLPRSFFESAGWLAGPLAWMLCAWLTARVVGLATAPVLIRAALAGVPSLLFVVLGLHWLGAIAAVALFAIACALLPRPPAARRDASPRSSLPSGRASVRQVNESLEEESQ